MNAPYEAEPHLRLPPHSVEAEQSVIGGLLLDNRAYDRVADLLTEDDFYLDAHRRIYRHLVSLFEVSREADILIVTERIKAANEEDQTGGLAYLAEVANATPSAANIRRYAETVQEHSLRRRLIAASDEIADKAFGADPVREAVDVGLDKLFDLADFGNRSSEPKSAQSVLARAVEDIEQVFSGEKVPGIPTGFADLDARVSLQPGEMIVIAGRPSMGKTTLAMNIAEHVGMALKLPTLVFSLEMGDVSLAKRMIASVSGIPLANLLNGRLTDADWDNMTSGLGKLHEINMQIDETSGLTVSQMHARARREKRKHKDGLGLIVIDYLQLIRAGRSQTATNRNDEVTQISAGVKHMAKDLGCPVIVLSQLSRKVEERADKRPVMSDLRESGAIEQDADVIILMFRDDYYNANSTWKGFAEANVAKHRNGEPGVVTLIFEGQYSRFRNADPAAIAQAAQAAAESRPIARKRGGLD